MIFEKKHYTAPGILRSLLSQSYFWMTAPWGRLRKDWLRAREAITVLNQNRVPVLVNPKGLPLSCLACNQCIEICPTQCLSLLAESGHNSSKIRSFKLNLLNCISCSKCVEVCPDLLVMSDVGLGPGPVESEWTLELIGFVPQEKMKGKSA